MISIGLKSVSKPSGMYEVFFPFFSSFFIVMLKQVLLYRD